LKKEKQQQHYHDNYGDAHRYTAKNCRHSYGNTWYVGYIFQLSLAVLNSSRNTIAKVTAAP